MILEVIIENILSFKNNLDNKEIMEDFINGLSSAVKEYINREG